MRQKLTDIVIRNLPFSAKGNTKHWDEATPGFGVRCTAHSKSFIVMYGSERRLKTLGRYPEISLGDARKQAKRLLAHDHPQILSTSLSEALAAYYEDCQTRITPRGLIEYQRHLRKLPNKPLSKITRQDINTADAHAVNACKVFFNWCIRNELTDKNPFTHIPVKYGKRERVLTPAEIKAVWQYDYPPYSDIVKLLLLTGQRRGEIMAIQPEWIHNNTITFPSHITKNRKAHTLPFGQLTEQYLPPSPFNGWGNAQKRMYRETGVINFALHDLRRTCATIHVEIGTPVHITEAILNHSSGSISGVAAIYIRADLLKEMEKAVLRYEDHIAKLVSL